MRNWGHCSHQRKPGCCPGHASQACGGRAAVGSRVLGGWVLRSEAGWAAPGPGSRSTVPGWGPAGAARCERSPAPPLGATPSRSRCVAASSPAGCAPPGRPRPPPAATAAPAAAARRGPWRQPPLAASWGGACQREGREGKDGGATERDAARLRGACGRPCPGPECGTRAATAALPPRLPAHSPARRAGKRARWFAFFLQEARQNSDMRSSNPVTNVSDATNALGALENSREARRNEEQLWQHRCGFSQYWLPRVVRLLYGLRLPHPFFP